MVARLMLLAAMLLPWLVGGNHGDKHDSWRPVSPCQHILTYDSYEVNSWSGVLLVQPQELAHNLRLHISLDNPATLHWDWNGDLGNRYGTNFSFAPLGQIQGLQPSVVKLRVTYSEDQPRPNISNIKLDGKQICPAETEMPASVNELRPADSTTRKHRRTKRNNSGNAWVTPDFNFYQNIAAEPTESRPSGAGVTKWLTPKFVPLMTTTDKMSESGPSVVGATEWLTPKLKPFVTTTESGSSVVGGEKWFTPNFGPLEPIATKRPVVMKPPPPTRRPVVTTQSAPSVKPHIFVEKDVASCGVPASQSSTALIWNGQDTTPGQFPWHSALYQSVGLTPDPTYLCGASLVTRRSLVTAAHCVSAHLTGVLANPATMVVYLGKSELNLRSEAGAQIKQVSRLITHPRYNASSYYADIAVVILSSRVEFTYFVLPVCLWDASLTDLSHIEGRLGSVVGWGYGESGKLTRNLKLATLPAVSQATCRQSAEFFLHFTSDLTYCAGDNNAQLWTSPCNGDSGGGMVYSEKLPDGNLRWSLRGIVSLAKPILRGNICDPKFYTIFTDVAKCLPFLAASIVD